MSNYEHFLYKTNHKIAKIQVNWTQQQIIAPNRQNINEGRQFGDTNKLARLTKRYPTGGQYKETLIIKANTQQPSQKSLSRARLH